MNGTPHERWRPNASFLVRGAASSALTGAVIGALFELGGGRWRWVEIAWAALVGLLIFAFSIPLLLATLGRVERRSPLVRSLALGALFFVAGSLAWLAVRLLDSGLRDQAFPPSISWPALPISLAVTSGLAALVGSGFYLYEAMRERVRDHVTRLKESEFATKELELARSIQRSLLPPTTLAGDGWRLAARNLPAGYVAGDFYDVFSLADGALGLVLGDVSGKGVGASLIMASAKAVVPLLAVGRGAGATLAAANDHLCGELARRDFVALCHARFRPADGEIELANAGAPDPYLLRPGEPPRSLVVPGPRLPLGLRPGQEYVAERHVLAPGDRLLLLSDGLPEAPGPDGEPLGYDRLSALFPSADLEPAAWLDELFARLPGPSGAERQDDWTALVLERL